MLEISLGGMVLVFPCFCGERIVCGGSAGFMEDLELDKTLLDLVSQDI